MKHPSRIRFLTFLALACLLSLSSTGVIAELACQDGDSSQAPDEVSQSGPAGDALPEGIAAIADHLPGDFIQSGVVIELQTRLYEREIIALSAPRSPPQ